MTISQVEQKESLTALYEKEQNVLKKYGASFPTLVTPKRNFSYKQILERIGVTADLGEMPVGYLNLHPEDFIVEEIDASGELHSIEPEISIVPLQENETEKTLYADMVKVGLSSIEGVAEIARALEITEKQISYAGIKDKGAITSQEIGIRNADVDAMRKLETPGLFLKNFRWGKGALEKGKIQGNRFVITIRTEKKVDETDFRKKLDGINGLFYNFYYLQRFGSPRLISHILGGLLLKQDYKKVLETIMCENGAHDVPLIRNLREKAHTVFGNWDEMGKIYAYLPYTFRQELFLIDSLKDNPTDYLGALKTIKEQTTLWIYAYASYLFNLHLSGLISAEAPLPERLPLLLHPEHRTISTYKNALEKNNIPDISAALFPLFGYNPVNKKNTCPTKASVKIIDVRCLDTAIIVCFELPGGSYATTFLAHLFEIYRGLPLPLWINTEKHDSKEILGIGSVESVRKILGKYMFSVVDKQSSSE